MAKKKKTPPGRIVENRKARHDFHLEERFEAGVELQGWEVKSLRAGKVQLVDSYVLLKSGEAFLLGAHITPLDSASTHVVADPQRTRRLLLHKKELARLFTATQAQGRACVCTALYWKGHLVKAEIALAVGKKQHDKRADAKDRDWQREKARVMKHTA